MRVDGIVDALPLHELGVEFFDGPVQFMDLIELLGVSAAVGLFHTPIEFGAFRRQHKQADPASFALGLKVRIKLLAAVHLGCTDLKGNAGFPSMEKLRS